MSKLIYRDYLFNSASISGVTAVNITQNAILPDQAVRLEQLIIGLSSKQNTLTAGDAIDAISLTGGTLNVLSDSTTIGLNVANELFVPDGGIDEAQLNSNVDAETFQTTPHSWSNTTGGTIQGVLEDLDASISSNVLTIAPDSQELLEISANQLSVKQLLITDVNVDTTATGLTEWIVGNYTGTELQEGDILILTNASVEDERTWIQNGGTGGTVADFTKLTSTLDTATIRALFSGGNALTYNPATGVFDVNVDDSTIEVNGSDQLQVKANGIDSTQINWGIGTADADDIPVIDSEGDFTGTTVEEVLHELQDNIIVAGQLETLQETLQVGNTTGGFDITMTAGDVINSSLSFGQLDMAFFGENQIYLGHNLSGTTFTSFILANAEAAEGITAGAEANQWGLKLDSQKSILGAYDTGAPASYTNITSASIGSINEASALANPDDQIEGTFIIIDNTNFNRNSNISTPEAVMINSNAEVISGVTNSVAV